MRKARRAVLIGINYVGRYLCIVGVISYLMLSKIAFIMHATGQKGQLSGCHNDAENIKRYLIKEQGFLEKDMLILMDDGVHHAPTHQNIINAFTRITQYSEPGDVVFVHYSGHGGRVKDTNGKYLSGIY
jgi:uncharacterized caspase-like protein